MAKNRINTRALAKLQAAYDTLGRQRRMGITHGSMLARQLMTLVETNTPLTIELDGVTAIVDPKDIRVSKTQVYLGEIHFSLAHVIDTIHGENDNGPVYGPALWTADDREVPIKIAAA
jgi:hypothetical protein